MITTWSDFTDAVRAAYWTAGTPTLAQQYRAVADQAHAIFVRQTESDLPLAKSFFDSSDALKLRYAGSVISSDLSTTQAAVKLLLPVDADTAGAEDLLNSAIEQAYEDFNGLSARFDVELLNAAMDLQRHVPFYQGRNETVYASDTSGLTNQGFVSQITLPNDFRIENVWVAPFHTALVENVAFAADDEVSSNGRIYKVVVGGTLTDGQLGNGLTEQECGVEETLGDLTFKFHREIKTIPVRKWPWADREAIYAGRYNEGPVYTVSPQFDRLWLYPALVDGKQFFMLEWVGVKTAFDDSDAVTFDILAAQAAAQYVRAMLAKDLTSDGRAAAAAIGIYQAAVRNAVVDNQARETGTTTQVSELLAMNLGRVGWWRWSLMNASCSRGTINAGNSEAASSNSTGTTTVVPTTANQVERITFTGAAGDRIVNLKPIGPYAHIALVKGSRIVVFCSFGDLVGINVIFQTNGVAFDPAVNFTSDGANQNIAIEFYFNGTDWEYLRAQIPA